MMKNNHNLSEHDYVLTFGMFYYSFNNDVSSLIDGALYKWRSIL